VEDHEETEEIIVKCYSDQKA
jgi:hypothetical protein